MFLMLYWALNVDLNLNFTHQNSLFRDKGKYKYIYGTCS